MLKHLSTLLFLLPAPCLAQEAYVELSADKTTLTFRYDTGRAEAKGAVFPLNQGMKTPAWVSQGASVARAVFDPSFADARPTTCTGWFQGLERLSSIVGMQYLDTSEATSMANMFNGCAALEAIDLGGFNTSKVTNMYSMFEGCTRLKALDLGGFDTSHVINMMCMFYKCPSLETLDVSQFVTSSVLSMYCMFRGCSRLKALDVSRFDTSKVTQMNGMFTNCASLDSLDVGGFDTSKATSLSDMFAGCASLKALDVSRFDTSSARYLYRMFSGCGNVETLDVSGFDTSKVTDIHGMFEGCAALRSLDVSGFDLAGVASLQSMFDGCAALESLDLGSPSTSGVTNMAGMFKGCASLAAIDLRAFDTSRVTSMSGMFQGCASLESIDVGGLSTSAATDLSRMFYGCSSLDSLDLSGFDLSKVYISTAILGQCAGLGKLTLPASFGQIRNDAFVGVGTEEAPCLLVAPAALDFSFTSCSAGRFWWKGGCFRFETAGIAFFEAVAAPVTAGRKTPLTVCLTDDGQRYGGFQFDLRLPSGFGLAKDGRAILYDVDDARAADGLAMEVTEVNDSTFRVVGRTSGAALAGGETPLLTLQLTASAKRCGQRLAGSVADGWMSRVQCYDTMVGETSFVLDVSPYLLGDVNHDGGISVVDVMMAVDHVLGRTSELFHFENADVDDDGRVGVADVMGIVKLVLGSE